MPATSEVQICSNALLMLGQNPIASLTEPTDPGVTSNSVTLCANLWPTVRDAVLRSHPWNVATKRVVLAYEAVTPAFDWSYSFLLPSDCLRVLSVGRDADGAINYQVENSRIYTDESIAYLRYIFQLTDVTKFDALLTLAMTAAMAANLAYPVTKSQTQQDMMFKLFADHIKRARSVNGQEDPPEDFVEDSRLILVRG